MQLSTESTSRIPTDTQLSTEATRGEGRDGVAVAHTRPGTVPALAARWRVLMLHTTWVKTEGVPGNN